MDGLRSTRAAFMRGGTSKASVFRSQGLPPERAAWEPIFLAAMGSPDPNGRQLDGMGGGVSSLSKVCVVGPPSRADADVDYTFAQVAVERATVDYAANCGNMSSAVGPFAVVGILAAPPPAAEVDITARMISAGNAHRALPLTGALCIAVAAQIPGTVAQALVRELDPAKPIRIGHPSGSLLVSAEVQPGAAGYRVASATVFRTARRLFQGEVLYAAD